MSDWKVGDLAECVHGYDWVPSGFQMRVPSQVDSIYTALFPKVGDRARVEQICVTAGEELGLVDDISICYLQLSGHPSSVGYDS